MSPPHDHTEPVEPLGSLLSPADVGRLLKIPVGTLANWRSGGKGPAFIRIGRHVRYRAPDLQRWIDGQVEHPNAVSTRW